MNNNLETYRTRSGLSQVELAKCSGVLQPDISRAEKGVKELKGSEWLSIANVLDCSVDELLGRDMK